MGTSFTRHAFRRARERLSLRLEAVAALLDRGLWVDIGSEAGSSRVHCLFLSPYDNACFVAVRDAISQEVVTILPLDYHANLAWEIPSEAEAKARALRPEIRLMLEDLYPRVTGGNVAVPSSFKLTACCGMESGRMKLVNLGSVPSGPFCGRIEALLDDDSFPQMLAERIQAKGMEIASVLSIYVRLGKNGHPVPVTSW